MSAAPGWYPDPSGQPGMMRYWDGNRWADTVRSRPASPLSPPAVLGPPAARTSVPGRRRYGWLLALIAVIIAVVVIGFLVIRNVGGADLPSLTGGDPTTKVCPTPEAASAPPAPADGRVHGGSLSYPKLGSPWAPPEPEFRVAFGQQVMMQSVVVETGGESDWLAAVLVGELASGDGFYEPREGAEIVVDCVSGTFYGNSEVTRDDQVSKAMTVDGRRAWLIESQLHFDVPTIKAKSERLIVVIVDIGNGSAGLFYASIPENAPELLPPARTALSGLSVDG